jgi:replicative DNA helicase
MPKRLLRGAIDFGDSKITDDALNANYIRLSRSNFEWNNPDERKIFLFLKDYVQENHVPPNSALIHDHFERGNELTVTEKLQDIKAVEIYRGKHYETLLKNLLEEQIQAKTRKLLQDVDEIITKGRIINKETVKGLHAGLHYFNQKIYEILPPETNFRTEGDVLHDANESWVEYQDVKLNKDKAYGRFTGLNEVDKTCHGIKRGEMWVHAAAPGHLKTTFALNWAYNLVTRYKANVLYVNLEMKYEHLRRLTCALHTANGLFRAQGYQPLDYRKIRDGELTPDEEIFYQKALNDFETNPAYQHFKVWAPDRDVNVSDIRVYAELMHRSMEVGLIIIDHGGLVKASRTHKDYTIELNTVLRDSKKMALHFNGGEGVPVLMLFQINRQGLESVEKKKGSPEEGLYTFSALSYANEAERSADYVTTTYVSPELKKQGAAIMANLKNRDNDPFNLTRVRVDYACRRMRNWEHQEHGDMGHEELSQQDMELLMNL